MNLHKVAGVAMALALTLSSTTLVGARWNRPMPTSNLEIKNEDIFVMTKTEAKSMSGQNSQWSMTNFGGDVTQKLTTGVTLSDAFGGVSVASTILPNCGCERGDIEIENEDLKVIVSTDAVSKTGANNQWSMSSHWGSDNWTEMTTGNAGSTAESNIMVAYTNFSVSNN